LKLIDSNCVFGRWPYEDRDVSIEKLLSVLEDLSIDKALVVSLRGVFYDPEEGNAETLTTCRMHDKLEPVATLRPTKSFMGKEVELLSKKGFRMLRLFPDLQGWPMENVLLENLLGQCTEVGMPAAIPICKNSGHATIIGRLAPEGCRVLFSDVYYSTMGECAEVMKQRPEFMLEMGRTSTPYSVEAMCSEVGSARLVLGTKQPLEYGLGAIEMVRAADIAEQDKNAILGISLSRWLGV